MGVVKAERECWVRREGVEEQVRVVRNQKRPAVPWRFSNYLPSTA